ncbi:MAG: sugar kinase [Gorillibacterium sp.]|nr:sugar kinase [Gorillibacterium sp.]
MPRIGAFGEVMMRLQVPGYETLSQSSRLNYSFSGSGVNVAAALGRFGHECSLISTLPDSSVGEAALAYLRKLGIHTAYINRGGRYVGMYFLENGFGVRPGKVTYTDRLGSSFNTAALQSYNYAAIAEKIDVIHFCGITLAMNDIVRKQMKQLAADVKANGGTVVFDFNYRPSLWGENGYAKARSHYEEMLQLADIVMMNEKDPLFILGMRTEESDRVAQLKQLIPQVVQQYGIRIAAGTHRQINADNTHSLTGYLYKEDVFEFSDKLNFSVYDRIGTGDAFTSGIVHGELKGYSPQQTVRFAAAAAMLAHTVAGDTPDATEMEIFQVMRDSIGDVER